jgi:hypothetical protein
MKNKKLGLLLTLALAMGVAASVSRPAPADANNNTVTLFASTARPASTTAYVQANGLKNFAWKGIQVRLKVTAKTGASTLDCKLQSKDSVTLDWYDLPNASFAQLTAAAATPTPLTLYPGAAVTSNVSVNSVLPLDYRLACLVGGTSMTFSAAGQLLE